MLPLLTRFIALILALLGPAVAVAGSATTYGPGDGFVIPDNEPGGASSSIVITHSGPIEDLDLILSDINHSWLGDLIITLTHEDSSTSWNITNRAGQLEGGDETFGFDIDLDGDYIIDDESTRGSFHDQISFEGGLLPPGDYNSLGSLSNFDGLDIAGTWTLSISDNALGDTGALGSWSLLVETPNETSTGLVFAFEESPDGVTGTLSGSLDLANAVSGNTNGFSAISARINPPYPFIATGSATGIDVDSYRLSSAPVFGPGEASSDTLTFASMFNGDFFTLTDEFDGGDAAFARTALVPEGYASGTALSASMFFADATFESLGITPGTYVYPLLQDPPITLPPDGSSLCTSDLTPGKTITVIAGEDAVLPFEDCLFSSRFENDTTLVVPDFHTDRDTFLENVQSFFEDPYDDIPEGAGGTVLQRTDGTFSYEVTAPGSGTSTLFNGNGFLSTNSEVNRLLFTFTGAPVTAVGGNFWTTDQFFNATGTDIILTLDDGTERVFGPSSVDSFAGFVTEVPIVSLSIEAPDNSSFPAADNLIVGQR